MTSSGVRRLTVSSVLLAIAVILNMYRIDIPIMGAPVLAITFGGPFLKFVAVLFGGVYGGIAGALCDVINYLINNRGQAFIWPLTLVEFLKGLSIGLIWLKLKGINGKLFLKIYAAVCLAFAAAGAAVLVVYWLAPEAEAINILLNINKNIYFVPAGLLFIGLFGMAAFIPAYKVLKESRNEDKFLKLLIAVGVPCLVFTTVNTVILQRFMFLPDKAFIFLWIPRFIQEIIQVLINTYVLMIFIGVYEKTVRRGYV